MVQMLQHLLLWKELQNLPVSHWQATLSGLRVETASGPTLGMAIV